MKTNNIEQFDLPQRIHSGSTQSTSTIVDNCFHFPFSIILSKQNNQTHLSNMTSGAQRPRGRRAWHRAGDERTMQRRCGEHGAIVHAPEAQHDRVAVRGVGRRVELANEQRNEHVRLQRRRVREHARDHEVFVRGAEQRHGVALLVRQRCNRDEALHSGHTTREQQM